MTDTQLDVTPADVGVRLGARSVIVLVAASVLPLFLFAWPLIVPVSSGWSHAADAPLLVAVILPLISLLVLAQLSDGMNARALAMLGVLSAINAALRPLLGAGIGGVETIFFTLVLAGYAFGPGFGFVLGCTSMFASALLTGGIGPWLPFQVVAAGWVGLGAGLLPGRRRRQEGARLIDIVLLVGYGVVASYGYGLLMNLWFWPTLSSGVAPAGLDYIPGAPLFDNLRRFATFSLVTSTATWDTGRAITTALAIAILGRPVLDVFRRAARNTQLR